MGCPELAKNLYLSKQANSARSILQSLDDHGLINCSPEVLQSTSAFERGIGLQNTCSCLVASAMAASLAKAKPEKTSSETAKKISSQIAQDFQEKYQTTKCSELINKFSEFSSPERKNHCAEIVEFVASKTVDLLTKQEIDSGNFSLTRFADYRSHLPAEEFNVETVFRLMQLVNIDPEEIKKCLNFSPENYTRNLFYKDNRFEILIMCWDTNQKSPIHDHDQSFSVEKVFSGKITNINYKRLNPETEEIQETNTENLLEGGVIFSIPEDIHKIEPAENLPAVSIHLYSPPLKQMKCFNLENKTAQWAKLRYLYIYQSEVWQSLASCYL